MTVDLFASRGHYLDHLVPIMAHLHDATFWVIGEAADRAAKLDLDVKVGIPRLPMPGPPVVVAGYQDAKAIPSGRRLALLEHGVGQSYVDGEAATSMGYPGGEGWERASLILTPGPHATERWRARYPYLRVVEVGCPKLDRWVTAPWFRFTSIDERPVPATVAFTWHWPCRQTVETWTAFDDWKGQLGRVELLDYTLLGHYHPRWDAQHRWHPRTTYARAGIEVVPDLTTVFERADLLVADNTSALYEFAATGRSVLCLNAARYRRDVEHGLRFWSHMPGLDAWPGADLAGRIYQTLEDPPKAQRRRADAVARAYGDTLDGHAAERAARAIEEWAG